MDNLTVKFENGVGNEITWREGKAADPLPLKEPKIINLQGDIHSVSSFLKIRNVIGQGHQAVDEAKVIVEANRHNRTIQMFLDPENYYGTTITGKLEDSEELKPFYINQEKKFDRQQLPLTWRPVFAKARGNSPLMEMMWTVWFKDDTVTKYKPLLKPKKQPTLF